MKSVIIVSPKGLTCTLQDVIKRLALCAIAIGFAVAVFGPLSARAEGVTQLQTLQWLAQVSGESSQFSASSTAADYIQWARVKGLNPAGGWQPNTALTRDALAQILVQLLKINPNKLGANYARILEREGIILPTSDTIDRAGLLAVLGSEPMSARVGPPDLDDQPGKGLGRNNTPHSPFKPHPPHPGDGGFPPGPPPGHGPGAPNRGHPAP